MIDVPDAQPSRRDMPTCERFANVWIGAMQGEIYVTWERPTLWWRLSPEQAGALAMHLSEAAAEANDQIKQRRAQRGQDGHG